MKSTAAADAARGLAGEPARRAGLFLRSLWPVWLAPVVLLGPRLAVGQVLFWGTPSLQFVPWWWQAWQQVSAGQWPLWNPLNGMGAPLLANYQMAFFYPPNWLLLPLAGLFGPAGVAWGYGLLAMLHLIWAGLGMAAVLRRLEFGWLAQVIGGLSFGLTGYVVGRLGFFSMTWAAAWLPWVLFCASDLAFPGQARQAVRPGLRFSPRLALSIAMLLLAGHAQLAWYTLLLAAAWVAWGALGVGGWKNLALRAGTFAAAGALAAAVAAVQLLPTFAYLQSSQRADAVAAADAMRYSFWPWRLITLFSPDFFGSPGAGDFWGYASYWEDHSYPGLLVLLLALASLLILIKGLRPARRSPRWHLVAFGWTVLLGTFLLALGNNLPLFPWLYEHVPTFSMFQAPARYLIWAAFVLPLLAAAASERWRAPRGRGLYWFRLGTAGAFAITLGALIAWFALRDVRLTFVRAAALTGIWGLGFGLLTLAIPWAERHARSAMWRAAVTAWLALDLLAAGWLLNPTVDLSFYKMGDQIDTRLSGLAAHERVYLNPLEEYDLKFRRFLRFQDFRPLEDWRMMRAALLPNLHLLEGVPSANNFDPLVPGRYARWMAGLAGAPPQEKASWLSLMNVALLERIDVSQPGSVRFDRTPASVHPGPVRWYSQDCVMRAASEEQSWQVVTAQLAREASRSGEPRVMIVEQADPPAGGLCGGSSLAELVAFDRQAGRIRIEIITPESGWIMVSETYDPGWQARVDGRPARVVPGNYLFQAVEIPSGHHTIELAYRPSGFIFGGLFSILGLLILMITLYARKS